MGSSPRIRGESATLANSSRKPGIIPANTGRMTCQFRVWIFTRDHPREYGENAWKTPAACQSWGSSPRIRGEWLMLSVLRRGLRIIPANTGRMRHKGYPDAVRWDHPREYGENRAASDTITKNHGSSPRIRGEYQRERVLSIASGIIPANTGRICLL